MIGTAIVKEAQLLLRDRGALASLFALPLIFIVVFGSMFGGGGGDKKAKPIAVYRDPNNAIAARVVATIERSGSFHVEAKDSARAVERYVAAKRGRVGLILPHNLDPRAGVPAQLIIDEAASIQFRGPILGAVVGILNTALSPNTAARPPKVVTVRSPPGLKKPLDDVNGFQVSVPGNAVLFGFFLALTVALSFVEERRGGTWRRLLAAPVHRPTLLVAKLVPYFFVGLVQMTFLLGAGTLIFGMQVGGSIVALCLLTVAVVFCAVALGLFIASFGGTEKQVGSIGSIIILVMGLLGGAMIPRLIMPKTMQMLGLAVPHGWALDGYYDILIRQGTTVADVAVPIAAVTGFGVVFLVLGALKFKFER